MTILFGICVPSLEVKANGIGKGKRGRERIMNAENREKNVKEDNFWKRRKLERNGAVQGLKNLVKSEETR